MFPIIIQPNLTEIQSQNWNMRFKNRQYRENCWRRHQTKENENLSLWNIDGIARRRILYFRDHYELIDNNFCLDSSRVFLNYKAPKEEIKECMKMLLSFGWIQTNKNLIKNEDLICEWKLYEKHPFEQEYVNGYASLDILFYQFNMSYDEEITTRPWKIFNTGIRQKLQAGNPVYTANLKKFLPAQVTLGCGPSIEAGIPPLNYLHKVYSLSRPDGTFLLKPEEDTFLHDMMKNPYKKYQETTHIHKQCLLAGPTKFYKDLRHLHDEGKIVGPVITNNFDGLCLSVGLQEMYMRDYDKNGVYPDISFHPDAKSLFVIGSHADRRCVEASARKQGLQVVYIDPCGYEVDGTFVPYPIESPQNNDVVAKYPANCLLELINR